MLTMVAAGLSLVLVDPLVKVFPGDAPVSTPYIAEVARGEVASWQVVLRSDEPLDSITIDIGEMKGLGKPRIRAILRGGRWRRASWFALTPR